MAFKEAMKHTRTPIASAVALVLLGAVAAAHAQTAPSDMGTVTVTGIRASLESAVNIKKASNAVVDAVSAEDIGKLPDADVGQSLGRIPGVAVGRAFGQGASVSIRGTDPQMTFTTLNGQTVASTGWYDQLSVDRSFNYSLLPSELIGGMEVYKSSQADLTEGGIGGTVIVKTRKPLDLPSGQGLIGLKTGKGTVSTDTAVDVSGLYSWKNDTNTFGVLIAGAKNKGDYMRRGTENLAAWGQSVSANTFVQNRKSDALNVTLQAKPVQGLDLGLTYTSFKLVGDNGNNTLFIFQDKSCTKQNATGTCLTSDTSAAGKSASAPYYQSFARIATMTSDSMVLNGAYKSGDLKVEGVVGTTKADGGTSISANYGSFAAPWAGTVDSTGKQITMRPTNPAVSGLSSSYGTADSWATSRGPNNDKEDFAQADLTLDLGWGMISSFKTGARMASHTFVKSGARPLYSAARASATVPFSTIYGGMAPLGFEHSAPLANIDAMVADQQKYITGWVDDRSAYGLLNEKNSALYGMFEFEQGPVRGNFGLRYISTKVNADGYKPDPTVAGQSIGQNNGWGTTLASQATDYNDVLPSLNVAYNLNKQTILRASVAQAITRPNYGDMFLGGAVGGYNDNVAGNESITIGNPALKPQKSTQFDLGVEYYYGKGNLLALTYFHKDIDNFTTSLTQVNQKIGITSPDSGKDNWTVNQKVNAGGGKVDGLEFQISHAFDNGFGLSANYTYTDASAPAASYVDAVGLFTGASKNNANLVGYYENAAYSARLAYNWRSEYMVRETGFYGNRMHDAFGSLDLSLGWNITKDLKLSFDATNLLKADDVQFGAAAADNAKVVPELRAGFPSWSFMGETTYRVSLTAKF